MDDHDSRFVVHDSSLMSVVWWLMIWWCLVMDDWWVMMHEWWWMHDCWWLGFDLVPVRSLKKLTKTCNGLVPHSFCRKRFIRRTVRTVGLSVLLVCCISYTMPSRNHEDTMGPKHSNNSWVIQLAHSSLLVSYHYGVSWIPLWSPWFLLVSSLTWCVLGWMMGGGWWVVDEGWWMMGGGWWVVGDGWWWWWW